MGYIKKFKEIIIDTLKGFSIGVVIAAILTVCITERSKYLVIGLIFTLIFGAIIAILFDLGSGHKNVINKVVTIVFKELHKIFKVDSYIEWIFRYIAFISELFFAAPIILYIFISYYIYIVYFGIMSILEKLHIIREDEKLFKKLNKIPVIISILIEVVVCVIIF